MENIQKQLFEIVKGRINKEDSLGNALSDVLHISPDAVYRRYRGETPLTVEEVKRLCNEYHISFDALLDLQAGNVSFTYPPLNTFDFSLESYLNGILNAFERLKRMGGAEMILSVNNINFFQLLNFPQLVRFKLYFWAKTHLQIPLYQQEKFRHEKTSDSAFQLGKEILTIYNSIPSKEIYDPEFMRGFLRQIQYYFTAHLFEDPEYALFLHDRLTMLSGHLQAQAIAGKKYIYGTEMPASGNDFQMFLNETINSDGTFYYKSEEVEGVFVTHNIMNYLETRNEAYVGDTKSILDRQLANSSQISQINEKERNNFFYDFERTISVFKRKIEADLAI
ncbi:MAG: helix-turn-helix domain-containing protein [Crocinitomicaceae bacterium]|jgi:hypothetical protein|nr:helix-turn-helix domain-containing protein [Crocinitomicaceae bacterium]